MIDQATLQIYARQYKIDIFTVLREYLQILLLNQFYQIITDDQLVFKGGTALRLIYGSPRFSEDLDFNSKLNSQELRKLITKAVEEVQKTIPDLSFREIKSLAGFSAKVYLPTSFAPIPLTIKLDFSKREKTYQIFESTIPTVLPISSFYLVKTMAEEEILAEKLRTIFQRQKGRDIYDIWYLLNKKVSINRKLVTSKYKMLGSKYDSTKVIARVNHYKPKQLEKDLLMFLPQDQRHMVKKMQEMIVRQLKSG